MWWQEILPTLRLKIPLNYRSSFQNQKLHYFLLLIGNTVQCMQMYVSDDKPVASVRIGKKGQIKIPKRSDVARTLMRMASSQNEIQIFLKDF